MIPWPTRVHSPNGISIGSDVFAQMTVECPYTLQWDAIRPKIAPSHGVWNLDAKNWQLNLRNKDKTSTTTQNLRRLNFE